MKNEELKKIKQEFLKIKEMGYVKSAKSGLDSIEYTFKKLIDMKNIQKCHQKIILKNKTDYTSEYLQLFKSLPCESEEEVLRLLKTYGYFDSVDNKTKIIHDSIQASCSSFIGSRIFKLSINYEEEKIYLNISDKSFNYLESQSYWSFNQINKCLTKNYHYLVILKTWTKTIAKKNYYKFYDIAFYELKKFDEILKLIANGNIRITFKTGYITKGDEKGKFYNYGPYFEIQEVDFLKLFDEIKI